jgi:hypothetical protein
VILFCAATGIDPGPVVGIGDLSDLSPRPVADPSLGLIRAASAFLGDSRRTPWPAGESAR